MPELLRIYDISAPQQQAGDSLEEETNTVSRERRLFIALSILASLDVMVICGLSTFYLLAEKL